MLKNALSESSKKRIKRTIITCLLVLFAGLVITVPSVIYILSNKTYSVTLSSKADNFQSYSVQVEKNTTISEIKQQINDIEGHEFIGVFKDEGCTEEFLESDKITKNTELYLKFEKYIYSITLPYSPSVYNVIYFQNANRIEWGDSFSFKVEVFNYFSDNMVVKANNQVLERDPENCYNILNIKENIQVTIENINTSLVQVVNLPTKITLTDSESNIIVEGGYVQVGTTLNISYTETENYIMSEFKVNNTPMQNNSEFIVTEPISIEYSEVDKTGLTFEEKDTYVSVVGYDYITENVVIPSMVYNKPVTTIEEGVFVKLEWSEEDQMNLPTMEENTVLKTIHISENISQINNFAFALCTSLTEVTFAENSQLTDMGNCTFAYSGIEIINRIPLNITEIGMGSFLFCMGLTQIFIPSGVTTIGDSAFYNCTSLTEIEIPNSVTKIGEYAFENCINLL